MKGNVHLKAKWCSWSHFAIPRPQCVSATIPQTTFINSVGFLATNLTDYVFAQGIRRISHVLEPNNNTPTCHKERPECDWLVQRYGRIVKPKKLRRCRLIHCALMMSYTHVHTRKDAALEEDEARRDVRPCAGWWDIMDQYFHSRQEAHNDLLASDSVERRIRSQQLPFSYEVRSSPNAAALL